MRRTLLQKDDVEDLDEDADFAEDDAEDAAADFAEDDAEDEESMEVNPAIRHKRARLNAGEKDAK